MSEFWLTTSDTNGVWTLMWNEVGTVQDNSVPVILKMMAQVTTRKKKDSSSVDDDGPAGD